MISKVGRVALCIASLSLSTYAFVTFVAKWLLESALDNVPFAGSIVVAVFAFGVVLPHLLWLKRIR